MKFIISKSNISFLQKDLSAPGLLLRSADIVADSKRRFLLENQNLINPLENELEIVANDILDTVRSLHNRRNSESRAVKAPLYETAAKIYIRYQGLFSSEFEDVILSQLQLIQLGTSEKVPKHALILGAVAHTPVLFIQMLQTLLIYCVKANFDHNMVQLARDIVDEVHSIR